MLPPEAWELGDAYADGDDVGPWMIGLDVARDGNPTLTMARIDANGVMRTSQVPEPERVTLADIQAMVEAAYPADALRAYRERFYLNHLVSSGDHRPRPWSESQVDAVHRETRGFLEESARQRELAIDRFREHIIQGRVHVEPAPLETYLQTIAQTVREGLQAAHVPDELIEQIMAQDETRRQTAEEYRRLMPLAPWPPEEAAPAERADHACAADPEVDRIWRDSTRSMLENAASLQLSPEHIQQLVAELNENIDSPGSAPAVVLTSDGTAQPPPVAGRQAAAAPAGDILDQIDAAVSQAEAPPPPPVQLCECGCRRAVRPDGPSEFFADQGCQQRWHDQNVDAPQEVYNRVDAHLDRVESTDRHADVGHVLLTGQDIVVAPVTVTLTRVPPCEDPYGAAYRRRCGACDHWGIPNVYEETSEVHSWANPQPVRTVPALHWTCPQCEEPHPGPALIATVTEETDRLILRLRDGEARNRSYIHIADLTDPATARYYIDDTWRCLERDLLRFARTWRGVPRR